MYRFKISLQQCKNSQWFHLANWVLQHRYNAIHHSKAAVHLKNLTSIYCAKLSFVLVSLSTKEIQEKVNKLGIMDTLLQDPCKVSNKIIMPYRFMVVSCQICLFIVMIHDCWMLIRTVLIMIIIIAFIQTRLKGSAKLM